MSTDAEKLAGTVALVTGGSKGIGAAIAKRLTAEGTAVAICKFAAKGLGSRARHRSGGWQRAR